MEHGEEASDFDDNECYNLTQDFIKQNRRLWSDDIYEGEVLR